MSTEGITLFIAILYYIAAFLSYREYQTNPYKKLFTNCWLWKTVGLGLIASGILLNLKGVYFFGGICYCLGAISYNVIRILRRRDER